MTPLHDPAVCKLGKQPAKPPRVLLADFVTSERVFAAAPGVVINSAMPGQGPKTVPLGMYLNDSEGDCTCAGAGNIIRVNSKGKKQIADADVQAAYVAVTGQEGAAFDPSTGANDNGCVPLDVLDYWTSPGIGGDVILGHAGINMKDFNQVRWGLWKFGAVYQGIQLATEQQNQNVWDFVPGSTPGSWGGHLFPLFDHPRHNIWTGGTWGGYKDQTYNFMVNQADEGHVLITSEWLAAHAGSKVIDVVGLKAALAEAQSER
jgi:hypothetical protein